MLDSVQKFILCFAAGWVFDDCHRGPCWLLLMHDGVAQHRSTHCRAIYCRTLVKLPMDSEFSSEAGSKCEVECFLFWTFALWLLITLWFYRDYKLYWIKKVVYSR